MNGKHMRLKLVAPLFVLLFAIASEYSGLDLALVRPFYDPATQSWPLKDAYFTAGVMHSFGKDLVVYAMVAILLVFVASFFVARLKPYRKGFAYLLLGVGLGPAVVALGKAVTHIYSPWDLTLFGGDKPYIRLFDPVPAGAEIGHAFPGGHSSGGFAWVALYFLFAWYCPQWRFYGLAVGLLAGGAFAATQEVRGAHFLSHDLFSLVICWYVAMGVFYLMYRNEIRARRAGV